MAVAIYFIDGLGGPPDAWHNLICDIAKVFPDAEIYRHDRMSSRLIVQMREELPDTKIVAVGHSLGGERIEQLAASGIKLHAAVLIDAVRGDWEKRPFNIQANWAISFTRRWLFGFPPSYGIPGRDVKITAGHNNIIDRAKDAIAAWLRGVI